jgi:hypothetical protein
VPVVGLVVEGQVDHVAAERVLEARGVHVDRHRVIVTGGKTQFDARLPKYNQAARQMPWLALRDSDRDAGDCPSDLRQALLARPQSAALCLRLAVRTIEAWLLADTAAFADHFAVPASRVPVDPELLLNPKQSLVNACRSSRRRDVRRGMAPPAGISGPGPEYTTFISGYCRTYWRPDVAAQAAPSLARALREIDRLLVDGTWPGRSSVDPP